MPANTPCAVLPYPLPSDPPDVAGDIQRLAAAVDAYLCANSGKAVGEIFAWLDTGKPYPAGSLLLNGATFNPATYPELANHLGGNQLPDLRGRFLMMANATYPVRSTGGFVDQSLIQHDHAGSPHTHTINHGHTATGSSSTSIGGVGDHQHYTDPGNTGVAGGWGTAGNPSGWTLGAVGVIHGESARLNFTYGGQFYSAMPDNWLQQGLAVDIPATWGSAAGAHGHTASTSTTVSVANHSGGSGPASHTGRTSVEGTIANGTGRNLPPYYVVQFLIQAA